MPTLHIKNMVCPRCIRAVETLLQSLGQEWHQVSLGQVSLPHMPDAAQLKVLAKGLKEQGFELLEDRNSQLVNQIKSLLIEWVHYRHPEDTWNLSERLSKALRRDYSTLSKTFSQHEGYTLEQYWMRQRMERAKELLSYGQVSVRDIAFDLCYSSTAHFSNQFKKYTGISPSAYRKKQDNNRQPLDAIQ